MTSYIATVYYQIGTLTLENTINQTTGFIQIFPVLHVHAHMRVRVHVVR